MAAHQAKFPLPIFVVFLLFHVVTTGVIAVKSPFPTDLDEYDHISYIFHVDGDPRLMPDYDAMRLIDLGDPSVFTDRTNPTNHPPYYYLLLSMLVDPASTTLTSAVKRLRLANMVLSGAAVALILIAGFRLVEQPEARFVFAVVVALCPKFGVMGGMINNDNLGLLGGAIAFAGLVGLAKGRLTIGTACLVGGGFVVAAATKLTAGLLIGFLVVYAHLPLAKRLFRLDRDIRAYVAVLLALMALGMAPYIANLVVYGTPHYVGEGMFPARDLLVDPITYLNWFVYAMFQSWATYGTDPLNAAALITVLGLAIWGGVARGAVGAGRIPGAGRRYRDRELRVALLRAGDQFCLRLRGAPRDWHPARHQLPLLPADLAGRRSRHRDGSRHDGAAGGQDRHGVRRSRTHAVQSHGAARWRDGG